LGDRSVLLDELDAHQLESCQFGCCPTSIGKKPAGRKQITELDLSNWRETETWNSWRWLEGLWLLSTAINSWGGKECKEKG